MTLNELIKTAAGNPFSIGQKPDYWRTGSAVKPTLEDWTKAAPAKAETKPVAPQVQQPAQPSQPAAPSGPAPRAVPWIEQPEGQKWQQGQRRQRQAYEEMNGFNDIVTRTPEVAQRMGGMPGATPTELLQRAAETENQILDEREEAERIQNEATGRAVTAENDRIAQRAQQEATARSVTDENNRIAQRAQDEQAQRDQEATAKAVAAENERISQRAKAEAVDEARANAAGQYAQNQMQERQRVAYEQQQRDNMHQYYMQHPGTAPYAVPAAEQPEVIAQRQEEESQQLAEQNRARQESQDAAMRFREGQAWTADQIAAGDEVDRARAEAAEQGAQAQALERQREAYAQQQQAYQEAQKRQQEQTAKAVETENDRIAQRAYAEQQAEMNAQHYQQAMLEEQDRQRGEALAQQQSDFWNQHHQMQAAEEAQRQQQWYQQWLADQARNAQGIMAENDRIAQDVQQQWQQRWHDQGIADIHDVILTNMFTDENGNEKIPTKEEWDAALPYLRQNYGDALVNEAMGQQIAWMEERRDIGIRMYNTALEWLEADPSHVIGDEEKAIIAQSEGFDDPGAFDRFVGSTNMYIPGRDTVVLRRYGEPVETGQSGNPSGLSYEQWRTQGIADIHEIIGDTMFKDADGNDRLPTKEEWDAMIPYLRQNYGDELVDEALKEEVGWLEERRNLGVDMYNTAVEWLSEDPNNRLTDEAKAIIAQAYGFQSAADFDAFTDSTDMYIPGVAPVALQSIGNAKGATEATQKGNTGGPGKPDIFGYPNANPKTDTGRKILNSPGFLDWVQQNPTTASALVAFLVGVVVGLVWMRIMDLCMLRMLCRDMKNNNKK